MPEYKVTWTIQVDADNPIHAAKQARDCQLYTGRSAFTEFRVIEDKGETTLVNLGLDTYHPEPCKE